MCLYRPISVFVIQSYDTSGCLFICPCLFVYSCLSVHLPLGLSISFSFCRKKNTNFLFACLLLSRCVLFLYNVFNNWNVAMLPPLFWYACLSLAGLTIWFKCQCRTQRGQNRMSLSSGTYSVVEKEQKLLSRWQLSTAKRVKVNKEHKRN